ncbi:MAG: hypothetical protein R6V72_09500, partial [Cyclobacterium sp.]|uniref:hypothetical protein n=1 Tax=Cyclobacterium sp. TaxID=1966343 RepID=UPI003970736E
EFFITDPEDNQTTHQKLRQYAIEYYSEKWRTDEETVEIKFSIDKVNNRGKYGGRIFLESKILTFWDFPENNNKLKEIVKDIEKELDIIIWDDKDYKIEILKNNELHIAGDNLMHRSESFAYEHRFSGSRIRPCRSQLK